MRHQLIAFLSIAVAACAPDYQKESAGIVHQVQSIQREQSSSKRAELAMALSTSIKNMPSKTAVEPAAVDKIAELLNDDSTRLWAAASLREIGPGARSAIPALREALADLKSRILIHNETLPLVYIEAALQAIETAN
jgi:HEAT repeat protein